MGHWHLAAKDVEAEKKLFLAMGGKLYNPGGQPLIMFPGVYINGHVRRAGSYQGLRTIDGGRETRHMGQMTVVRQGGQDATDCWPR